MTDRESIVAFIKQKIEAADTVSIVACQNLLAEIERCADLKPAKPKATIADLLTLHDLDLGALAHNAGATFAEGMGLAALHVDELRDAYTADDDERFGIVAHAMRTAQSDGRGWVSSPRVLSAIGAKVRAALSAPTMPGFKVPTQADIVGWVAGKSTPTIKVSTPRVLQSADEAPPGSLMVPNDKDYPVTLHYPNGRGCHIYSNHASFRGTWLFGKHEIVGPVTVIAEGLTEPECRHLSGLTAADAVAWCKARDKACATHDAAVIDRLQRDGDSLRSLLAVIRHALGAGDHDDIVKHARAIKARADRA